MTPVNLFVTLVRHSGSNPADRKELLVTHVMGERNDWRVTVFWPGGTGEIDYSLARGEAWRRSRWNPWKLTPESARALVVICSPEIRVPECCTGPLWWAAESVVG